jgi:hypothetical protein
LPVEWRPAVWDFWSFFALPLKDGQLTLASRLRHWIKSDNLTLAEADAAFAKIMRIGGSSELVYGHQVLAKLDEVIRESRKAAADREKNAETLRRAQPPPADPNYTPVVVPIHRGKL